VQCFNGIKTRVRKEVGEVETDTEKREEILGMQRKEILGMKILMKFSFEMFLGVFYLS
jgi:hypothetical protein